MKIQRLYYKCTECLTKDDSPCILTLLDESLLLPTKCPYLDTWQKTNWSEITKEEFVVEVTNQT